MPGMDHDQAFIIDILEENDFMDQRRKLLRQRAGLTDADRKKATCLMPNESFRCVSE